MAYNFSLVSVVLGYQSNIAISQLSKFQARLKNLHRLGWPLNFQSSKGKASEYSVGDLVDMAMAMELLQLGLTPERAITVLSKNRWKTLMAYRMAAAELIHRPTSFMPDDGEPDGLRDIPASTFVYFDPCALHELTKADPVDKWDKRGHEPKKDFAESSFFFGGNELMARLMGGWNSAGTRLAVCNVTAVFKGIGVAANAEENELSDEWRARFYEDIHNWAAERIHELDDSSNPEGDYLLNVIEHLSMLEVAELANFTGAPLEHAKAAIAHWERIKANGEHS